MYGVKKPSTPAKAPASPPVPADCDPAHEDRRKIQPAGKPGLFYPLHKRTQLSGIYPVSSGAGHQQIHIHSGNFSRLPHNRLQLIQRLDRYGKLHSLFALAALPPRPPVSIPRVPAAAARFFYNGQADFSVSASIPCLRNSFNARSGKKQTVLHQDRKLFKCTHRISGLFDLLPGCRCIYRTRFRRLRDLFGTDFHPHSATMQFQHKQVPMQKSLRLHSIFIFCSCST